MARPKTAEQLAQIKAAEKLAETRERKEHMAKAQLLVPKDQPPIDPPAPSLDPNAGQS